MSSIHRSTASLAILAACALLSGCLDLMGPAGSVPSYTAQALSGLGTPESETYHGMPFQSYGYALSPTGEVVGMAERDAPRESYTPVLWRDSLPQPLYPAGMCQYGTACEGAAYDINARGEVVGRSGGWDLYGWYWHNGEFRRLPTLGGPLAIARSINKVGEIVGWSDTPTEYQHAVLWRGDKAIDLGTLGGLQSEAFAINDDSHVVGWARPHENAQLGGRRAFLWQDGQMIDIAPPGWDESVAHGINARGQIVGWIGISERVHAFVWQQGKLRYLDEDRSAYSVANKINKHGDVVGHYMAGRHQRAALWKNGKRYDLRSLLPDTTLGLFDAYHINDAGQIVAIAVVDRRERTFLLSPVRRR